MWKMALKWQSIRLYISSFLAKFTVVNNQITVCYDNTDYKRI